MPAFNVTVPHALDQATAQQRVAGFLESVRQHYAAYLDSAEGNWSENMLQFALSVQGFSVTGTLLVETAQVQVTGSLPLAAAFFRGRIEQTIRDELLKLLG